MPKRRHVRWSNWSKAIARTRTTVSSDPNPVVCLRGTPVSPGFARGPLVLLADGEHATSRGRGNANEESNRLRAALAGATADLTALMERADDTEAEAIL